MESSASVLSGVVAGVFISLRGSIPTVSRVAENSRLVVDVPSEKTLVGG